MPKRYWLHGAAIGGILIALLCAGESGAQSNSYPSTAQAQQQQPATPPPPVVQQPVTDAGYYTVSCDRPKEREDADLCEQRRQAQAAEDSVWWLRFQTYLGIFGAALVLCSLWFTGWAAVAAGKAAKSAEASIHNDRAWLALGLAEFSQIYNEATGELTAYKFLIRWENTGRTPALDCRGSLEFDPRSPDADEATYFYNGKLTVYRCGNAGPGKSTNITMVVPIKEIHRIRAGETKLFLYARMEYRDIYRPDEKRHSEASLKVSINGNYAKKVDGVVGNVFGMNVVGTQQGMS